MKYITNVPIDPWLVNYVKTNDGDRRPGKSISTYQKDINDKWLNAGYDFTKIGWDFFNYDNIVPNYNLEIPGFKNISWWISKLNPGDMFPLHIDTFPEDQTITRYWIACEDHSPGHVFMYDKEILTNYKAGDVFEIDPNVWHGACNIGFTPKISIQVVISH